MALIWLSELWHTVHATLSLTCATGDFWDMVSVCWSYYVGVCVKTKTISQLCSLEHRQLEDWSVLSGSCRSSILIAESCQQHLCLAQLSVTAGPLCQALQAKGNKRRLSYWDGVAQFYWYCVVGLFSVNFCKNVNSPVDFWKNVIESCLQPVKLHKYHDWVKNDDLTWLKAFFITLVWFCLIWVNCSLVWLQTRFLWANVYG